jgi:polysaccharide biosynthesis protein PelF
VYDVCLLLEGTFPYVSGGVSAWVYDLIRSMPHIHFSVFFLGARRPQIKRFHYPIPDNVVDFREHYLFDHLIPKKLHYTITKRQADLIGEFVKRAEGGDVSLFDELVDLFDPEGSERLSLSDLAYSRLAWQMILDLYARYEQPPSILDYFWTWRMIYLTLFSLLQTPLPSAHLYHSVSTGYAGILGCVAKKRTRTSFILTEHGIYNRERRIEIAQADWIYSESAGRIVLQEGQYDILKKWWADAFAYFSKLAYERCDEILTISLENRRVQISEGADPAKLTVIPNGVDETILGDKVVRRGSQPRVALVGRVVPIKDIKTYIRAAREIVQEVPDAEVLIIGPTDEDEEYYESCVELVRQEGLEEHVQFTGKVDMREFYPTIDVQVLTSHSEGQPLVILEGGLYGIPTVATNVGACQELLEGGSEADQLIGPSGIVTPLCDPHATASAVIRLLKERPLHQRMAEAAKRRISTHYRRDQMVAGYLNLYSKYLER